MNIRSKKKIMNIPLLMKKTITEELSQFKPRVNMPELNQKKIKVIMIELNRIKFKLEYNRRKKKKQL